MRIKLATLTLGIDMNIGPKHRSTMYAVVRLAGPELDGNPFDSRTKPTLIGAYVTAMRAEEVKDASAQTMKDLGIHGFLFEVQAVTFYAE